MFGLIPFVERLAFGGIGDGGADDEVGCGHGFLRRDFFQSSENSLSLRQDPPSARDAFAIAPNSVKARGQSHDLAVEAIEAVMTKGLAGIALFLSAADPTHARAACRPFDERINPGRQCGPATILTMMDDEGVRQRCRRAEDRHDIAAAPRGRTEESRG